MRILGIMRNREFSPNHVGNDAAIFDAVASRLNSRGCEVVVADEAEFLSMTDEEMPRGIFHMARRHDAIARLCRLEVAGHIVINPGLGVINCGRENMTKLLIANHVPHPASACLPTSASCFTTEAALASLLPGWIKRGDFHAMHREDVSFVRTPDEADAMLGEYRLRGIDRVVVNEHLHGDLIKFYGVADTPFFYWFYPMEAHHSKFGLEQLNDAIVEIPFDEARFCALCDRAARVLGVSVYGGDAIVSRDGQIRIIDFNDWPSFAPCRDAAADSISALIIRSVTSGSNILE